MATNQLLTETPVKASESFSVLIDGAYKKVFDMALRLSGNRQDAEDITQDACVRAFRGFHRYEGDRPFLNWMYRIVARLHLDLLRARKRRLNEVSIDAPILRGLDNEISFDPADTRPTPEQRLLGQLLSSGLQQALNSLSEPQRELVQMVDIEGMPHDAMAEAEGVAEGTIRSRLHRAHRAIEANLAAASNGGPERLASITGSRRSQDLQDVTPPQLSIAAIADQIARKAIVFTGMRTD